MIEFIKELEPASFLFGCISCMIFDVIFAFTHLLLEKAFEIKKRNKKLHNKLEKKKGE